MANTSPLFRTREGGASSFSSLKTHSLWFRNQTAPPAKVAKNHLISSFLSPSSSPNKDGDNTAEVAKREREGGRPHKSQLQKKEKGG